MMQIFEPIRHHIKPQLIMYDDDLDEIQPVADLFRSIFDYDPVQTDSIFEFSDAIKKSDVNDIIVSDKLIEGVNDLDVLGFPNILTSKGTSVGVKLLTEYCGRIDAKPKKRLILTKFKLDRADEADIRRAERDKVIIKIVKKKQKGYDGDVIQFFKDHISEIYKKQLSKKLHFIFNLLDEWSLSDQERTKLMGGEPNGEAFEQIISGGILLMDLELRCDLLFRLKQFVYESYDGDKPDLERAWLRSKNAVLDDHSPLEFLQSGSIDHLSALVDRLEGPW